MEGDETMATGGTMTLDFDNPVIDVNQPGFASLLPVLQGLLDGDLDDSVLQAYVDHLRPRLNVAYEQVEAMREQPFEQMGFTEDHMQQLRAAFSATQATVVELHQVLLLCENYLQEPQEALLLEAEERLALVHGELRQVL